MQTLLKDLSKSLPNNYPSSTRKSKLSLQLQYAKARYQYVTGLPKEELKGVIRRDISRNKKEWKHDHYRVSQSFSVCEKSKVEEFPDNNTKYNTQFLQRSLHGTNLKFQRKNVGLFGNPEDRLYSQHYRPIVKERRKEMEDLSLRASLYGDIWLDRKKEKVMDQYHIQVNPFTTPRSNNLLATMHKDLNRYRPI